LWLAKHGKPVESHETPVGETQAKEVVTDETQGTVPAEAVDEETYVKNGGTPTTVTALNAKASNKEPVEPVEVTPTDAPDVAKSSNKPTTVRGWLETIPDEKIREAALGYCSSTDAAKECTVLYAAIDIVTSPRWKEEGSKFWHECMDADYYRKPWPAYPEKAKQEADSVSHPSHYTSHPSGVECITITKHMNFCRGNAMKYLWRAGQKGDSLDKEIEDIAKAEEYCRIEKERLIALKGAK